MGEADKRKSGSARGLPAAMVRFEKVEGQRLFAHQQYFIDQLLANPGKSMGLFYGMGTGKTAPCALFSIRHYSGKVVYMGPKSLHSVFQQHVQRFGGNTGDYLPGVTTSGGSPVLRYSYITSEAVNVLDQMLNAIEPVLGRINLLDRSSSMQDERGEPKGEATRVLVFMDECHIFSARVAKILSLIHYGRREESKLEAEEKQAYKLYKLLCRDPRIRIVAMTGTPIRTHPFNFVPLANMLRKEFTGVDGRRALAFPEVFGRFYDAFIRGLDTAILSDDPIVTKRHRHRGEIFAMRLRGLIVWYDAPKGLEGVPFPVIESEEVVEVRMGAHQWEIYRKLEEEEKRIEDSFRTRKAERQEGIPIVEEMSVYRSLTRQASNFAFPKDMYLGKKRKAAEMIAQMPDSAFERGEIGKYSCKIDAIVKKILSQPDRIHGVYSHFVEGAGIAAIEKVLRRLGWLPLSDEITKGRKSYEAVKAAAGGSRRKFYMKLTGQTPPDMKDKLIAVFNQPGNATDLLIPVVLYSGAAAHGLTFKSGRAIHFLEPQWDDVEERQARDRFVRLGSAAWLPPDKRSINVYHYMAVHPTAGVKEKTTDQYLLEVMRRKKRLNDIVIGWIKMGAVNCADQFAAENALHASLIERKIPPPSRTFFRCVECEARYVPSFFLQDLTDPKCSHTTLSMPTKGGIRVESNSVGIAVESEKDYFVLDPDSGLGWHQYWNEGENRHHAVQVMDSDELLILWREALKKK